MTFDMFNCRSNNHFDLESSGFHALMLIEMTRNNNCFLSSDLASNIYLFHENVKLYFIFSQLLISQFLQALWFNWGRRGDKMKIEGRE